MHLDPVFSFRNRESCVGPGWGCRRRGRLAEEASAHYTREFTAQSAPERRRSLAKEAVLSWLAGTYWDADAPTAPRPSLARATAEQGPGGEHPHRRPHTPRSPTSSGPPTPRRPGSAFLHSATPRASAPSRSDRPPHATGQRRARGFARLRQLLRRQLAFARRRAAGAGVDERGRARRGGRRGRRARRSRGGGACSAARRIAARTGGAGTAGEKTTRAHVPSSGCGSCSSTGRTALYRAFFAPMPPLRATDGYADQGRARLRDTCCSRCCARSSPDAMRGGLRRAAAGLPARAVRRVQGARATRSPRISPCSSRSRARSWTRWRIPMLEVPGFEADDVIATLVRHRAARTREVVDRLDRPRPDAARRRARRCCSTR